MRADSTPWQPGWDWRCGNLVHCYMPVRPTHFKDGSAFGRTVGGKDTGREGHPPGSPPQHSGDRFYSTEFRVVRCKETRLEGPPCVGNRQGFPRKLSRVEQLEPATALQQPGKSTEVTQRLQATRYVKRYASMELKQFYMYVVTLRYVL